MKFDRVVLIVFVLIGSALVASCDSGVPEASGGEWQEELLLQLDELRQSQNELKSSVLAMQQQVADLEKRSVGAKNKPVTSIPFAYEHVLGNKEAKIAIVEISDFECPFCARHAAQVFPQLKSEFVDKGLVRYAVSDFPLSFHRGAKKAAVAVRCAGEQGKYWEMYDEVFADKGRSYSENYKPLAESLELEWDGFSACVENPDVEKAVESDISFAESLSVDGTPRFVFGVIENDRLTKIKMMKGAQKFENFSKVIEEYLQQIN